MAKASPLRRTALSIAALSGLLCAGLAGPVVTRADGEALARAPGAAETATPASARQPQAPPGRQVATITREGVNVEFSIEPEATVNGEPGVLREGGFAEIAFRITSAESGEPLRGVYPGAWVDIAKLWNAKERGPVTCKERVGLYLRGLVGVRPMIDLNSYYVMVMNRDASISVVDPVVGISGITSLYATIRLKRPGADWAKTRSEKWLYVSMPRAGEVAVVDLDTFKVETHIAVDEGPTRVALQPDGRYLWVGNNARPGETGGVTVIDTVSHEIVAHIPTGRGHHEIAFSDDDRYAFVSNRDAGTVSVIDIDARTKVRDLETGTAPIALATSALSKSLYVADGRTGAVTVIDYRTLKPSGRIELEPGLGPMRFSEDGRWGVLVNPAADAAYVLDAATNRIAHTVPVSGKPFQVTVSDAFAYIRALETERVSMINLNELDSGRLVVSGFAAGSSAPSRAKDISIADVIVPAANEAAALVVSPADATVYYYMEGMNAPMGAFRNYGHAPRAATIANRALKEVEPGVYATTVRVPTSGTFDIAFLNEAPRFLHCFAFEAAPNPLLKTAEKPLAVDYLIQERRVNAGKTVPVRFRLTSAASGEPRAGVQDVRILYFRAPNFRRRVLPARHIGEGVYEAEVALDQPGAYYVYVAAPSQDMNYSDLEYLTLMAVRDRES